MTEEIVREPLIKSDPIVFGILMVVLAIIFATSSSEHKFFRKFYRVIPALLLCYLIPSLLSTFGIISGHSEYSGLYGAVKNYMLPASLALLTLSIDLKAIVKLGPKSVIMFLTATIGIVIGGPLSVLLVSVISPDLLGSGINEPDALWKGLATLAGSWIGGSANQTAMLEMFQYDKNLYGGMLTVDIVVANIWMAFLLYGAADPTKIDKWLKADSSAIEELKLKVKTFTEKHKRIPTLTDVMKILGVAFGAVALSHVASDTIPGIVSGIDALKGSLLTSGFFWLVMGATTLGLVLSFTRFRELEGAGASRIGSVFIYILVAVIGTKMDITKAFEEPGLILVGLLWMAIHVLLLFIVAKIIRAPFFFLAVGSKANIGGAASAPIVASAFHPSLAPVGVLLAVLGYALGTYGATICALMMQMATP